MKNRNVLLYIVLSAVVILNSCAGTEADGIKFDTAEHRVSPGNTIELQLNPTWPQDEERKISKFSLKPFGEAPEIEVTDGLKILSVKISNTDEDASSSLIIRADESLLSGDVCRLTAVWAGYTAEASVKIKKQPSLYIDASGVITDYTATDAMINKKRRLPASYIPSDLVRVDVPTILNFEEVNHLRKPAADALADMFAAAKAEEDFTLCARSGYRSYKTQVSLFDANVRAYGREYADQFSAKPGTSEHQSGLAMDITAEVMNYQLEQEFGQTPEGLWTAENAHRFGFIIRYLEGKEGITGYAYEPWHLRYVGKALAGEIFAGKLTLEEYYGL